MDEIRIISENDYDLFMEIIINAYPGEFADFKSDDKEKMKERLVKIQKDNKAVDFYGLYRENQLLGVQRLHDFTMNMKGEMIKVGGVGLVAVDLVHKKEGVAKGLITYFLKYLQKKSVSVAILYPFRADFYKKMGFGYGTKMNLYNFLPSSLPKDSEGKKLQFLTLDDVPSLFYCYMEYVKNNHGMIERTEKFFEGFFKSDRNRVLGYKTDNKVEGYVVLYFKKAKQDNFIYNDIVISELIYNSSESLKQFSNFFHKQSDQINRIIFATQDENFHFILSDARNGTNNIFMTSQEINTQGRGIMYRIVDIQKFFEIMGTNRFGAESISMKLIITDSFLPKNTRNYFLQVTNGNLVVKDDEKHDVEIKLDISDFSSLVVGSISFSELTKFGLVEISNKDYISVIDNVFRTEMKPICMTQF